MSEASPPAKISCSLQWIQVSDDVVFCPDQGWHDCAVLAPLVPRAIPGLLTCASAWTCQAVPVASITPTSGVSDGFRERNHMVGFSWVSLAPAICSGGRPGDRLGASHVQSGDKRGSVALVLARAALAKCINQKQRLVAFLAPALGLAPNPPARG